MTSAEIKVSTDTATPMVAAAAAQMPFAVARALTWVAEDVKFKMAEQVRGALVIRVPWVGSPNRWVVTPAKKQDWPNLVARVDLDHRASFLADYATGKVRLPGDRAYDRVSGLLNQIYLPTKTLRPSFEQRVPQMLTPKAIGVSQRMDASGRFLRAGEGKHSRKSAKDAKKRFWRMRPGMQVGPAAGIWERFGSGVRQRMTGNDRIRFLWKGLTKVTIPKKLHPIPWAEAEIMKQWPDKMERSLALAIATAKPSAGSPWRPARWMGRGQ